MNCTKDKKQLTVIIPFLNDYIRYRLKNYLMHTKICQTIK